MGSVNKPFSIKLPFRPRHFREDRKLVSRFREMLLAFVSSFGAMNVPK